MTAEIATRERKALARHQHMPEAVLARLASDDDFMVRETSSKISLLLRGRWSGWQNTDTTGLAVVSRKTQTHQRTCS